jgi:PIN domain nuclease of toxin-antitoxin system
VRFLLDTHIFIWWSENSPKLPANAHAAISDPTSELFVSTASIWEIVIKTQLGKLSFPAPLEQTIPQTLFHYKMTLLPMQLTHLFRFHQLPLHHRDLFDRMLVAQALVESLTLVTVDKPLHAYGVTIL